MPDGTALIDIKPDGSQWRWATVRADRARVALACGIAAISGGWKLYVSLPDDPTSNALEIIGLSNTIDRPEATTSAPGLLLHVKITPAPHAGAEPSYAVTVTDSSATPIEQAAVRLHNYTTTGADDIQTHNTDNTGHASFANVTLRSKTTVVRLPEGERVTTVTPPKLSVSKDGFDAVGLNLL
jgi:hypothetical protein